MGRTRRVLVTSHLRDFEQAFSGLLGARTGAGWIRLPAGGVLLHEGHFAAGVFVAATGTLRITDSRGLLVVVPAPCVVPRVGDWHVPSTASWSVLAESDLLFFPRSRLIEPSRYRKSLERLVVKLIVTPDHSAEEHR